MSSQIRNIAAKIQSYGSTHPMELIMFPLILLIVVGIPTNMLGQSGLQTTPTFQTTYPCTVGPDSSIINYTNGACSMIAQTNPSGCASNLSSCSLLALNIKDIFQSNSPFTYLIHLNIIGFFGSMFSSNNGQASNGITQLQYCTANQGSGSSITAFYCEEGSGVGCFIYPAGLYYNATSNSGNQSNWSIEGYQYDSPDCNSGFTNNTVYVLQYGYYTAYNATYYTLHFSNLAASTANLPNMFAVVGWILGIALLFMGFGWNVTVSTLIAGGSFGINQQGTKLAQAFGIALFTWSFVYSEFGFWLTDLYFEAGIPILAILTTMYFLGNYWRLFSYS